MIYIPVLFVCVNGTCNFMQAATYYTKEQQCKTALAEQMTKINSMADQAGQTITILQGACITAREEML